MLSWSLPTSVPQPPQPESDDNRASPRSPATVRERTLESCRPPSTSGPRGMNIWLTQTHFIKWRFINLWKTAAPGVFFRCAVPVTNHCHYHSGRGVSVTKEAADPSSMHSSQPLGQGCMQQAGGAAREEAGPGRPGSHTATHSCGE